MIFCALTGKPPKVNFNRVAMKAECKVVEVTFQVCVRGHLYSQITGSKPYSQGEVEQVCKYVLHGVPGMTGSNISIASLENKGFVTYKLPANREYYIFFEVFTNAEVMNVSYDNFSKTLHNYKSF